MSKRANKKNANKRKGPKPEEFIPYTERKLPDGTRMFKIFADQTDEDAENAAKAARYLLRFIDWHMVEAILFENQDENGNPDGAGVMMYCKDDEKGDMLFTITTQYANKKAEDDEEIRDENVSHNEAETETNKD